MVASSDRVQLYRILADESRLRLLALVQHEALTVGELALLMQESQPQISRKAAALRQATLLEGHKDGTRTFLSMPAPDAQKPDVVLQDALRFGEQLVHKDGSMARIPEILAQREEAGRALFDAHDDDDSDNEVDENEAKAADPRWAHLQVASHLFAKKGLLVDVGCGEGTALDLLAPFFKRVLAVDRSRARLAKCAKRMRKRAYAHVQLVEASFDDTDLLRRIDAQGKADVVFAGRILHHVSRPQNALAQMARMLKPDGQLAVLEYGAHDDEKQREKHGDVWLGFSEETLQSHLASAGLHLREHLPIHPSYRGHGPDAHLPWHLSFASLSSLEVSSTSSNNEHP